MTRNAVAIVSSILFVALAALLVLVPVPYVAWRPGQTIDVLGNTDSGPIIAVTGLPTYDTPGQLLMTTVSTTRHDSTLSLPEAMFVYFAEESDAIPREVIYPPGLSSEQVQSEAVAKMDQSRDNATVAALRAAGVAVSELPRVDSVVLSGPSGELLLPGDLILAVDGEEMSRPEDVGEQVRSHAVGDAIVFTVLREGRETQVTITAAASNADPTIPVAGITVTRGYRYSPRVTYGIDSNVTGPSAGLVFALGVYDRITEQDLLADAVVAGTGTIDPDGRVGSIGAIREKIKGAERDGATVFLVPEGNCAGIGGLDTDLQLVKVATLREAIAAIQLINEGNSTEVPTCG
ncbi:YlbL family protein [Tessaracoccus flavus]|uniref:YlbL family protein n=2 Tax=Tessaracoccus flavus TaxID=1610493 RepID=UPI00089AAE60|nr:PDZ domain-containing protein [Tessaracoccus flavus]SDZ09422.1 PDZ domain-containing protein [Tessaracoccus flavus]